MRFNQFVWTIAFLGFFTTFYAQGVPDVKVKTLDGKELSFQQAVNNDKITVVSFWATWCAPCKKELDALTDFYPEWKKKYNVEVIAVTIDDARTFPRVKGMVDTKGWDDFVILSDQKSALMQKLGFQNVPYSFIFKGGKIVYSHDGYNPGDEDELDAKIKALAKK